MNRTRRLGCQTFTWEMLGDDWCGGPDDLLREISDAGYAGIEITDVMIRAYADRPADFARRLDDVGLALAAFAFGSAGGFTEPVCAEADLEAARRWSEFAAHFPGAVVSMGSATVMSGGGRYDKFDIAADIYNRALAIGTAAGVDFALHPSSHHDTLLFSRADYDEIFARLDPQLGWVPDTGHMLRGGQAMDATLAAHAARIRYIHLKDVDAHGDWTMLGEGTCDIGSVIALAERSPRFNGWIVVEEESATASADPAAAVRANLQTMRRLGFDAPAR